MNLLYQERLSDSPYVEKIMQGRTIGAGVVIRPAECSWHMVITRYEGDVQFLVVGPLTSSGIVEWIDGVEILWIKFKVGTFIPHLPAKFLVDKETPLPEASSKSFWLQGSAWQLPDSENADTFVHRLVRNEVLVADPVVNSVLQGDPLAISPRTVRHRFLQSTGMSHAHIRQFERAHQAAALLEQGMPILDTVFEAGYFDQPHLTRSLKRFVGVTPAELVRQSQSELMLQE